MSKKHESWTRPSSSWGEDDPSKHDYIAPGIRRRGSIPEDETAEDIIRDAIEDGDECEDSDD